MTRQGRTTQGSVGHSICMTTFQEDYWGEMAPTFCLSIVMTLSLILLPLSLSLSLPLSLPLSLILSLSLSLLWPCSASLERTTGMEEDRGGTEESPVATSSPSPSLSPSRRPLSVLELIRLFRLEDEEEEENEVEEESLFLCTSLLKADSQKSSDVTIEGSSKSGQGTDLGVIAGPSRCCVGEVCVSSWQ